MQQLMLRLDRVVRRRRALVLALWLVALLAALPFAAKQSDHLTGGGYTVPDSQSDRVATALDRTPSMSNAAPSSSRVVTSSICGMACRQPLAIGGREAMAIHGFPEFLPVSEVLAPDGPGRDDQLGLRRASRRARAAARCSGRM